MPEYPSLIARRMQQNQGHPCSGMALCIRASRFQHVVSVVTRNTDRRRARPPSMIVDVPGSLQSRVFGTHSHARGRPMRRPASKGLLTRRQFALASALSGAAAVIGCHRSAGSAWDFLSDNHARILAALCDQIIPADDFPSASQAGVVTYIDRQLARHYRRHQDAYRAGLEQADAISRNASASDSPTLPAGNNSSRHSRSKKRIAASSNCPPAHHRGLLRLAASWRQSRCSQLAHAGPGRTAAARPRAI